MALLEERQINAIKRMDMLERQNERDIEKLTSVIKETELRIMDFVRSEFADIEKSLSGVIEGAKAMQAEQAKLAEANKEQQQQAKINEAQTSQAILGIAGLVAFAEIILRFVL